jgi:AcrR family transcriptional regulator
MATQHEPRRADAQQNRERILRVAHDALTEAPDASLNSIAKLAGVGPGTLYRHFPNREALVLAVYRYDVQHLADAAPALLAAHPPVVALRRWFDQLARYGMAKQAVADVLHSATGADAVGDSYEPISGAITLLLRACADAGAVRPGLDPDDVLLLIGFLWRIDPRSDWQTRTARMLDLVMDGLRAGAPVVPQ